MNKFLVLIVVFFVSISCKKTEKGKANDIVKIEFKEVKKGDYELSKPTKKIKSVLVLFGGYPETPEDVKREFKILDAAMKNGIAIVFMNYNQKLWINENEKQKLAAKLQSILLENILPLENIYFGGFSSGGNVALLIGDYLNENDQYQITPNGIFIVDSPIDLAALYFSSEKNIARNFSNVSVQESTWILETLGKEFGNPHNDIFVYEKNAVFTSKTKNINNIKNLKNTKIRLYTEPDTLWWKTNRMANYEQMNAYYIKMLSEKLNDSKFESVEYIATKNKGYRANGERHPHSWAIVAVDDLINWMLEQ